MGRGVGNEIVEKGADYTYMLQDALQNLNHALVIRYSHQREQ